MELILIRDDRLKIMLTEADMTRYSLSCDNIDYGNAETRHALWSILDTAKHQIGFDASSSRIFVQVYTSKCGGCEMYITKLSNSKRKDDLLFVGCSESDREKAEIWGFGSLDNLTEACRSLKNMGCRCKGKAYSDGRGKYFLELCDSIDAANRYYFVNEYASAVFGAKKKTADQDENCGIALNSREMAMAYISERCTMLSEDAVEDLSALCKKR